MFPRTEYEMTQADYDTIIEACRPVPMIMLHIRTPSSPQENANRAWEVLGKKMGFDYMTVRPSEKGKLFFTAVPSETATAKAERLALEAATKKQAEIERLRTEIKEREDKLAGLVSP